MALEITWISHASFRIAASDVLYIDPWKIPSAPRDGNVVFISHAHFDHYSGEDINKVLAEGGTVVAPPDVIEPLGHGQALSPAESAQIGGVNITAVAAYNVGKDFHPKANQWLGAVFEMDARRVYFAGDTDRIDEMGDLADIDVALLPVGGKYTMNAAEASAACADIGCRLAIPYHFGDIVGTPADGASFAAGAACSTHVLTPGESLTI